MRHVPNSLQAASPSIESSAEPVKLYPLDLLLPLWLNDMPKDLLEGMSTCTRLVCRRVDTALEVSCSCYSLLTVVACSLSSGTRTRLEVRSAHCSEGRLCALLRPAIEGAYAVECRVLGAAGADAGPDEELVPGSPWPAYGVPMRPGRSVAFGYGLARGFAHSAVEFSVSCREIGACAPAARTFFYSSFPFTFTFT